jgi:hypothetical protein
LHRTETVAVRETEEALYGARMEVAR